jgi:hypothetical protein
MNVSHVLGYELVNSLLFQFIMLFSVSTDNMLKQTRSKKKCWLNLLNFGCHLLQNNLLRNVYSDPIGFSTPQKHRGSRFP